MSKKTTSFLAGEFERMEMLVNEMGNIGGKIGLNSGQGSWVEFWKYLKIYEGVKWNCQVSSEERSGQNIYIEKLADCNITIHQT